MKSIKIPVGILGATGSVGQKFIELLAAHPVFTIKELAASGRSAGKVYGDTVNWILDGFIPEELSKLKIKECAEQFESRVLFSALDSSVAGQIESELADRGHIIISNAKNHRWSENVPLIVPEINPGHLELIKKQKFNNGGCIITNPNCSTIGLVLALKPLQDKFGLDAVNVVTMQALSGAGYPGVPSLDILDNVIPYIEGEEEKLESEPKKIFGSLVSHGVSYSDIKISAQCNRVHVKDGHLATVQVKLKRKAEAEDLISVWKNFTAEPQTLGLHSAPVKPVHYLENVKYPQPRLHRDVDKGMAVTIGRLRECSLFDYKFAILSHNTVRGAAGGTILIAELLHAKGYIM